jgi:hypothetical protein
MQANATSYPNFVPKQDKFVLYGFDVMNQCLEPRVVKHYPL